MDFDEDIRSEEIVNIMMVSHGALTYEVLWDMRRNEYDKLIKFLNKYAEEQK